MTKDRPPSREELKRVLDDLFRPSDTLRHDTERQRGSARASQIVSQPLSMRPQSSVNSSDSLAKRK